MIELILVRHGETDSNVKGTYLGWTDVDLNEKGIQQAYRAKEKLKGYSIDAIYCSPLKRVVDTANIINQNFNMEIELSDDLKERNFGKWDDLTLREIMEKFKFEYDLWVNDWKNHCVTDGESAVMAYDRIKNFIDGLLKNKKDGTFLIVTHSGCIKKIISYLLGMGLDGTWRFDVDNAALCKLKINDEGYAYLTALNA